MLSMSSACLFEGFVLMEVCKSYLQVQGASSAVRLLTSNDRLLTDLLYLLTSCAGMSTSLLTWFHRSDPVFALS